MDCVTEIHNVTSLQKPQHNIQEEKPTKINKLGAYLDLPSSGKFKLNNLRSYEQEGSFYAFTFITNNMIRTHEIYTAAVGRLVLEGYQQRFKNDTGMIYDILNII